MNNGKKKLLLLFTLPSILCLLFYFFVIRKPISENVKPIFNKLPYFGTKKLVNNDTLYFSIEPFEGRTQDGEIFSSTTLNDNTFIVSFLSAKDNITTPRVLGQLYAAQEKLKYLKKTKLISLNTQPSNNGVKEMFTLSNKVHAKKDKWLFLEIQTQNFKTFAQKNFWIFNDTVNFEMNELAHSLFLVDNKMHIRGVYDATYVEDVKRLMDEAIVLDAEMKFEKNRLNK